MVVESKNYKAVVVLVGEDYPVAAPAKSKSRGSRPYVLCRPASSNFPHRRRSARRNGVAGDASIGHEDQLPDGETRIAAAWLCPSRPEGKVLVV